MLFGRLPESRPTLRPLLSFKTGQKSVTVTFAVAELDGDYAVFIEQNWITNRAVTKKDAKGFTVQFEKPAAAAATFDWMIVR